MARFSRTRRGSEPSKTGNPNQGDSKNSAQINKQTGKAKEQKQGVRPYVLDVVRALADEIRGTKTITIDDDEDEDSKSKTIVLSDDSDSDSIILVDDLTNSKANRPPTSRVNEDNESFITIDETSFFKQNADTNPSNIPIRPLHQGRRRSLRKKTVVLGESPKTVRKVVTKKNSLEITTSNDQDISWLRHLKNTDPARTNPLSPLVRVCKQGTRYFEKSPARKAAGKITKKKNNLKKQKKQLDTSSTKKLNNKQAKKNTSTPKKKVVQEKKKKPHQQQRERPQCFWGPATKTPGMQHVPYTVDNQPLLCTPMDLQNLPLREVIVDGQNVACGYGNNNTFNPVGIKLVVDFFKKLGHKVVVILPNSCMGLDKDNILRNLEKENILSYTPSRKIDGQVLQPYDDRFIIQYASDVGGVVVSRDQYRDLMDESPEFRDTIVNRLLMYTFIGQRVYFPKDPLGKRGPDLEQLLRFDHPMQQRPVLNPEYGPMQFPQNNSFPHPLQPPNMHPNFGNMPCPDIPFDPNNVQFAPNGQPVPYFNNYMPPPNMMCPMPMDFCPSQDHP